MARFSKDIRNGDLVRLNGSWWVHADEDERGYEKYYVVNKEDSILVPEDVYVQSGHLLKGVTKEARKTLNEPDYTVGCALLGFLVGIGIFALYLIIK